MRAEAVGKRHFLVSGAVEGAQAEVRDRIQAIADGLAAHGLVYGFEIDEIDHPENSFVIRHPDF